jgi:hypothetical protein
MLTLLPKGVQRQRRCTLGCKYLCKFSEKFETAQMGYSGAWEKLIHEKPEVKNLAALSL